MCVCVRYISLWPTPFIKPTQSEEVVEALESHQAELQSMGQQAAAGGGGAAGSGRARDFFKDKVGEMAIVLLLFVFV